MPEPTTVSQILIFHRQHLFVCKYLCLLMFYHGDEAVKSIPTALFEHSIFLLFLERSTLCTHEKLFAIALVLLDWIGPMKCQIIFKIIVLIQQSN